VTEDAAWENRVADLLKRSPATGGNALVLGWNSGGLARELVRQSSLNIIIVEPDAAIAAKVRTEFSHSGLPGRRVQVRSNCSSRN
jgi:spermidine synthase